MAGPKRDRIPIAPGTPPRHAPPIPSIKVDPTGNRPRVILSSGPDSTDAAGSLTAALAHSLWQLRGGESIANWADAERLLTHLLSRHAEPAPPTPEVTLPRRRTAKPV